MTPAIDWPTWKAFATALLIGALVGLERERRKAEGHSVGAPGIRTFILVALAGAIGGWLAREFEAMWVLGATLLAVTATLIAGYLRQPRNDPDALGLTTEMAALGVCLLGAMSTLGHIGLAVALGIAVSAVLTFKQPLHQWVRNLGSDDLVAGLKLLIASFIVLPVLPNRTIDPWNAINPYKLWLLVVLISALSLVGYIATRWLGPGRGMAITGVTGGLVSSTAVTLSLAKRSRESAAGDAIHSAIVVGVLLAWLIMFGRVLVMVLMLNRDLLVPLAAPYGAMALATAGAAYWARRSGPNPDPKTAPTHALQLSNPFSLTSAIRFGLIFAVVLLLVRWAEQYLPAGGVYVVAAVAGLTDVDAITLSMADPTHRANTVGTATMAITIAALSNTMAKAALVVALGSPTIRKPVLVAALAIVVAGIIALTLSPAGLS